MPRPAPCGPSCFPGSWRQHRSGRRGLSTEPGSVDRGVGRAATIGRMTLDLALDHLAQAAAELADSDADPRAALLAARVTIRGVDQMLADLLAA